MDDNMILSEDDARKMFTYLVEYIADGMIVMKESAEYMMTLKIGDVLGDLVDAGIVLEKDVPPLVAGYLAVTP